MLFKIHCLILLQVTSIMRDSSIGNFVDVSVVKLVILKKNPVSCKAFLASAVKSLYANVVFIRQADEEISKIDLEM